MKTIGPLHNIPTTRVIYVVSLLIWWSAAEGARCTSQSACWPSDSDFRKLGGAIVGDVVMPGDKAWASAIKLKNKRLDIIPGAVVMAENASDISAALRFAAASNPPLAISIKSTGHCYSGNCMSTGSLHLDLTRMKALSVDTKAMEMYVQPGANFEAMYKEADKHGVQVVGGMCPTVGPVGYSLGGGHGPLIRSLGLGSDNILSVNLITAAGDSVTASATTNPDLFWALQGGGGGAFGVVTSMVIRVHKAPKQLVSLSCAWPLERSGRRVGEPILAKWSGSVMPALPQSWQFFTVAMKRPLGPKVPKFNAFTMNGLLIVEGLYNGEWGDAMMASAKPVLDLGRDEQLKCDLKNYTSFKEWHDQAWFASEGPILFRTYMASSFVQPSFDPNAHAKLLTDTVTALPADAINMMFGVQLGGQVSHPAGGRNASAISADFRSALFMQENDSDWNFKRADKNQIDWARSVGDAVAALQGVSGSYMNEPDPSKARGGGYEDLFWGAENFRKLQKVKDVWDKKALFDCKQCVYNS